MNVLAAGRGAPALQDLLGASFVFNSKIHALVWDGDIACFGLADGAVVMLCAHWDGGPALGHRVGGGIEITAGTIPPPPPAIYKTHAGAVLALAAIPTGGILSGGADGNVSRLVDGKPAVLESRPRREIKAVATGRGGRHAFAAGRNVEISGPEGGRLSMPGAVTALAYDPAGLFLAIGFEGGVSLEACGIRNAPRLVAAGRQNLLAWRPHGGAIAVAGANGHVAIRDRSSDEWLHLAPLPGPVTGLAYMADHTLVIAGDNFIRTWHAESGEAALNFALGKAGIAPIACHPGRSLIAYATADGAILLGRPGSSDAMLLRDCGSAITVMSFSPDGEALAFGADDGEAGTVMLPALLFRSGGAA